MLKAKATHATLFRQYLDDVRSGKRLAGQLEKAAVDRFIDDRKRERANEAGFPYIFNDQLADMACDYFGLLEHTDGEYAGQPFTLHPWQNFIVRNLFGWVHRETKLRRFREAFLSVARGNGKSPFGAALMLYLFGFDYPLEERAEVYTAAVKRDQAGISFSAAKRFVERAGMKDYIDVFKNGLAIRRTDSVFEPLSSDAKSADGLNIHGLLRDELHAWSEYQREYYEKLQTALGKRRQPLAVTITTAGSEESNIWREEYNFAKQVVLKDSPVTSDSLFVSIFEIDDEDDELDERVWGKSNPMLEAGVVKIQYLRDMAKKAKADPVFRSQFRRYHGNKLAYTINKSMTAEIWSKGSLEIPEDEISHVFAGVDLGWCDDLAAVGFVAPIDWVSVEGKSKRRYAVWADAWIPAGTKRDISREPFAGWIKSGRLVVTDSEWTDTAYLYERIEEINKKYGIKSVAYDPANAREFATNLVNELGLNTFGFQQQHAKYHEPLKEFKIALSEGRIIHGDDSLLGWSTLNVVEDRNAKDHAMPSKHRSEDKIDPFVAVLMAFSEAMFAERTRPSVYETRGPLLIG